MEIDKLDRYYRKHAKFYNFTRRFFLFNRRTSIEMLMLKPEDRVLDIACGTGLNVSCLLEYVPANNITGVDHSESMLEIATVKFPGVELIRGDVSCYDFSERFDKVICSYSLSMIDEWEKTIENVISVMNSNGTFVILDFHKWTFAEPVYKIFRWWLGIHGVDAEREPAEFVHNRFEKVEKKVLNYGYNYIIKAEHPKLKALKLKGGSSK